MTQYTIGIRDLKAHLSSYLEKVQNGHTIIITSHGKPIAQLTSTHEELMDRVKALQAAGLIAWSGKKLRPAKPVMINKSKKLASDIYMEMQNESLY
jgi:prevent-host-death family protein